MPHDFYGRPAFTMAGTEHGWRPLTTGWSLGGLSPQDRDRLIRFVMADPRRGDTGKPYGPALGTQTIVTVQDGATVVIPERPAQDQGPDPFHEAMRLFEPAPEQMPGQTNFRV